jgi:acyl carrier protein
MASVISIPRTSAPKEGFLATKIRACIAEHLGVTPDSISNDVHFGDDLGLDLIDIVELTIALEKQFADERVADDPNTIEFVGDLIRLNENGDHVRAR